MDAYSGLKDNDFILIKDMGTAPIVGAMIETLKIPEFINTELGNYEDSRKIVNTGTAIKLL